MDKLKLVFTQALMITTGIVFTVGVEGLYYHLIGDDVVLSWYHPFSFILAGILGALATMLFFSEKKLSKAAWRVRWVIHFVLLLAVISLLGYIFCWYATLEGYMFVAVSYVLIYAAVVAGTRIFIRREEALINRALEEIRDEE